MSTCRLPKSLRPFEVKVLSTVKARGLFPPGARVLVALSGGADSTALLHALRALAREGEVGALAACHVDHALRPSSGDDARACEALCRELGVDFECVRVDVAPGENLQAAARRRRYAALRQAAARLRSDRIATGHTLGDQAETVLHRLLRGAGARGLAGIPPRRGLLVRPLLDVTRREIVDYLAAEGIAWREDPTNASPRFLRNRIRAEVLPLLESLTPGATRRLARTADLLRADDRALAARARRLVPGGRTSVDLARLDRAPLAIRRRAVRRIFRAAAGDVELSSDHVDRALRLVAGADAAGRPRRLALPGGFDLVVRRGVLWVAPGLRRRP